MIDKNNISSKKENTLDPQDWDVYRKKAHEMLDRAINHLQGSSERDVWTPVPNNVKSSFKASPPINGVGIDETCGELLENILPYSTGNTHPRFFGWVHGSGTAGSLIADIMASAMNSNLGGRDHGANYVEQQVIDWCKELFEFPKTASGLVVSGTSMATIIALTAARYAKAGYNIREEGIRSDKPQLVGYTSSEAHSCIARAFDQLGLGMNALRVIAVDENFKMKTDALQTAIKQDIENGLKPFCVVGSAATVNTGACDDLEIIANICDEHDLWYHIDGAFGAIPALSKNLKPKVSGIERAHSIAFDFHKWMHVQYDAGMVLIREEKSHREAYSLRREYLTATSRGPASGNPWFCEYGPELSRGFRALKIWFTLKEHGITAIAEKAEDNCAQAAYLTKLVNENDALELLAPTALNIVCFRHLAPNLSEEELNSHNQELTLDIQESGIALPSTTKLNGKLAIRVNITNHRTQMSDMDLLIKTITEFGGKLHTS